MDRFIRDFKHTVKEDIRIFFAPYTGAYKAIKEEFARPGAKTATELIGNAGRMLLAPFVGAFKGVKAEFDRIDQKRCNRL